MPNASSTLNSQNTSLILSQTFSCNSTLAFSFVQWMPKKIPTNKLISPNNHKKCKFDKSDHPYEKIRFLYSY